MNLEDEIKLLKKDQSPKELEEIIWQRFQASKAPSFKQGNMMIFGLAAAAIIVTVFIFLKPKPAPSSDEKKVFVEIKQDLTDCRFMGLKEGKAELYYMEDGKAKTTMLVLGSFFRELKVILISKTELILQSAYGTRYKLEAVL